MLETIMTQLPISGMAADSTACCVQGGQTSTGDTSSGSFASILSALVSGLEKGMDDLKNGVLEDGAGQTITLEELARTLLGEGAGEAEGGGDPLALLEQMIAQLQAAMTQPAVMPHPAHPHQGGAGSSGEFLKINLHMHNDQGVLIARIRSEEGTAKINLHVAGDSMAQVKIKTAFDAALAAPGQPPAETGNEQSSMAAMASVQADEAESSLEVARPLDLHQATKGAPVAAAGQKESLPNPGILAPNASSPRPEAVTAPAAMEQSTEKNVSVLFGQETTAASGAASGSSADTGSETSPVSDIAPEEPSHLPAAALHAHQTYGKEKIAARETVHISRLHDVSEPMMKTLGAGEKHLVIKLSPPDLGDIQIRLKMENGVLTADFKVESNAVKELFSLALPQIRSSIESSGIRAGEFFVDLHEEGYSDGRTAQEQERQQQHKRQREPESRFFDYFA